MKRRRSTCRHPAAIRHTTMTFSRIALFLAALAPVAAVTQSPSTEPPVVLRWHEVRPAMVEGKGWTDTEGDFARFPSRARDSLRKAVWDLSRQSSGLSVRFTSDATQIRVRWTATLSRLALPHMPATGVSGLDLYAREQGTWYFVGGARSTEWPTNDAAVMAGMTPTAREFLLCLPLYNGVSRLEVGVPEDASFRFDARQRRGPWWSTAPPSRRDAVPRGRA